MQYHNYSQIKIFYTHSYQQLSESLVYKSSGKTIVAIIILYYCKFDFELSKIKKIWSNLQLTTRVN